MISRKNQRRCAATRKVREKFSDLNNVAKHTANDKHETKCG